jgi:hypothetical protein
MSESNPKACYVRQERWMNLSCAMMHQWVIASRCIAAILFLASAALSVNTATADSTKEILPGDPVLAFKIHKWPQRGAYDAVQLAKRQHIIVIEFWAGWCLLYRTVLPMHDRMQAQLQNKGVRFLTAAEGRLDSAGAILKRLSLRNAAVAYDEGQAIYNAFFGGAQGSLAVVRRRAICTPAECCGRVL